VKTVMCRAKECVGNTLFEISFSREELHKIFLTCSKCKMVFHLELYPYILR